jgi:hypothetical protein
VLRAKGQATGTAHLKSDTLRPGTGVGSSPRENQKPRSPKRSFCGDDSRRSRARASSLSTDSGPFFRALQGWAPVAKLTPLQVTQAHAIDFGRPTYGRPSDSNRPPGIKSKPTPSPPRVSVPAPAPAATTAAGQCVDAPTRERQKQRQKQRESEGVRMSERVSDRRDAPVNERRVRSRDDARVVLGKETNSFLG